MRIGLATRTSIQAARSFGLVLQTELGRHRLAHAGDVPRLLAHRREDGVELGDRRGVVEVTALGVVDASAVEQILGLAGLRAARVVPELHGAPAYYGAAVMVQADVLRAWWGARQGLDAGDRTAGPAEVLESVGWARSVGGVAPTSPCTAGAARRGPTPTPASPPWPSTSCPRRAAPTSSRRRTSRWRSP